MTPKLRALDINIFEVDGEEFLHLHDRLGWSGDVSMPSAFAQLLSLMDGTLTIEEIGQAYARRFQEELPRELLENLVAQLDEALLLDSPRFAEHRRTIFADWNDSLQRPPAFAGRSYPADPDQLRETLNGFFLQAREIERSRPAPLEPAIAPATIRGIVVPHIDFRRGGAVEALAYRQLLKAQFDTIVVLGIAHCGVHYPFCGTAKDYDTPLGTCRTDREFIESLQGKVGPRLRAEHFAHKNEHSIEFVATFLQHLENLRHATIVPILCGGFFREIESGVSPQLNPDIGEFIEALREEVERREAQGQRVGFIASVDLAHVGTNFGHEFLLTPSVLEEIESADREFLGCIEAGDAEGLHTHISRDENARHVDAHPAVYTLLKAFPSLRAQLLHYAQAYDEGDNSVVSFASLTLMENSIPQETGCS